MLNPVLTFGQKANSIEADLCSLIFAGLMRFDSETGKHRDFLADHILSSDKKKYTFRLKENLIWHDGEKLTADDVIFTFRDVIQNPDFKNEFLKVSFSGVEIKKIDERTITFTLPKPYKFFLTNFTVGVLPRHLLEHTPVKNFHLDSFNQMPIGAGPFKFDNVSTENTKFDEIRLSKFKSFPFEKAKIDFLRFRLFHQKNDLILQLNELDSVRPALAEEIDLFPLSAKFKKYPFFLPQYVAVFVNMNREIFSAETGEKMRWALSLATDKNEILNEISGRRVDTPLLEIDSQNWLSETDLQKARGGLKDSGWFLPSQLEKENENEAAEINWISRPTKNEIWETTETNFFIAGEFPPGTKKVLVDDYKLNLFNPEKGEWSFNASLELGTLKFGENIFTIKFFDEKDLNLGEDKITIILKKAGEKVENAPEPGTDENEIENVVRISENGAKLQF